MISKEKLQEQIDKLPEKEFSLEELIERLIFNEKLESRSATSKHEEYTISDKSLREEVSKWSK